MNEITTYLQAIISQISDAAAILTEHYHILRANQPFEGLFGVSHQPGPSPAALAALNLKLRTDRPASPQTLTLADGKTTLVAFVYLLDKIPGKPKRYLLILKPANLPAEAGRPRRENSVIRQGSSRTETLGPAFDELVGADVAFRKALVAAQRAAKSDISVLIIGESGTGKEILARAIHQTSERKNKSLVDVNCAAIPDSLIESELFGYEKGAFTGARTEGQKGYFDEAHEGTILLDEIGDSSLSVQSKLLRVLETGVFKRVGGTKNIKVNVRIISATNQDLAGLIEQKKFREDLFFRLNTFTIYLPPLRERPGDIGLLVDHFLRQSNPTQKPKWRFSPSALKVLHTYHWPGNVRELKGVVSYAVNMTQSSMIDPGSLPNFLFSPNAQSGESQTAASPEAPSSYNLIQAVQDLERNMIGEVLSIAPNKSKAIKMLGISRRTFYLKMKEYGLE